MNSDISFCICLPFSCFCSSSSKPATVPLPCGSFLSAWEETKAQDISGRAVSLGSFPDQPRELLLLAETLLTVKGFMNPLPCSEHGETLPSAPLIHASGHAMDTSPDRETAITHTLQRLPSGH